jgi:ferredoxin
MTSNITWGPNNQTYEVSTYKTLLHSLLEIGISIEFDCLFGHCRRCLVQLNGGDVEHDDVLGVTEAERQSGLILLCSCKPKSKDISLSLVTSHYR